MSGGEVADWSDVQKAELLNAAYEGNMTKISELLKLGVHVDSADDDEVTAIQIAAFLGNNQLVTFLLEQGADLESTSQIGMTPFLHACREGKIAVVDTLLQRGADIHKSTGMGASALTLAAAGAHMDVVKKLVSLGVGVSARSSPAMCPTPLIAAAFRSSPQICGFLILRRAAIVDEIMDALLGLSALSCTIMCATTTVVFSALLDLGAEPRKRTLKNKTAFELARMRNRQDMINILADKTRMRYDLVKSVDVRQLLLDGHLDSAELTRQRETELPDGSNPLLFAAASGNPQAVCLLLNLGVSQHAADARNGLTAVQISALLRHDDITSLLVANSGSSCYFNAAQMSAFDYYISSSGDHDALLRATLHCYRPPKVETKLSLSHSSNTLTKVIPGRPKEWLSKMSSQLFINERSNENHSIEAAKWRDASMYTSAMEGRNQKKLILLEHILNRSKSVFPKRPNSNDTYMEVVRNMAAESKSFMVNCFYDHYTCDDEQNSEETSGEQQKTHNEYDAAMHLSTLYGYQSKPRLLAPRNSIVLQRRESNEAMASRKSRSIAHYDSASSSQPRTTPRMLKKSRDSIALDEGSLKHLAHHHDVLRKTTSTPQLVVPTVLSSSNQNRMARSQMDRRRSQIDILTGEIFNELRRRSVTEAVLRTLETEEIDGETFLALRDSDFVNLGISPNIIRILLEVQRKFHY